MFETARTGLAGGEVRCPERVRKPEPSRKSDGISIDGKGGSSEPTSSAAEREERVQQDCLDFLSAKLVFSPEYQRSDSPQSIL